MPPSGWLPSELTTSSGPASAWLVRGSGTIPISGVPAGANPSMRARSAPVFMIGIDPHKGSHTAAAVDHTEAAVACVRVNADRHQRARLLEWAAAFEPRTWAVEGATGMGALLAQQLVAAGERVLDVPPKLSSRVRLLDTGRIDKTDPNDARSAAIVAWRTPGLNVISGDDEHRVVLRLLADRYHQLTAQRTRTVCRLHALLCVLIEGGPSRSLSAERAEKLLANLDISDPGTAERVAVAHEFVAEIPPPDDAPADNPPPPPPPRPPPPATTAPPPSKRPPDPRPGTGLNPRGDRQLNHALHMAAVTQVGHDTLGRAYYLRKQAEGHTHKEALRALKRRISDAVYRRLLADTRR